MGVHSNFHIERRRPNWWAALAVNLLPVELLLLPLLERTHARMQFYFYLYFYFYYFYVHLYYHYYY